MTILNDRQIAEYCGVPNDLQLRSYVIESGTSPRSIVRLKGLKQFIKKLIEEDQVYNLLTDSDLVNMFDMSLNESYSFFVKESIIKVCITRISNAQPMISPFVNNSVRVNEQGEKILSYGVSSFGYDFRVAPEFKIFTNALSVVVDPKDFNEKAFVEYEGDVCIIPPNSFVLARTLERFCMPDTVMGLVSGKSTYARVGIFPLVTPAEPGWEGYLTLEFANSTPLPARLYANEGGLQMTFFEGERPITTYSDRDGKYQGQGPSVVLPKV